MVQQRVLKTSRHTLERDCVFSESSLWQMQQRYFAEKGVEAWRQGDVPQYVTSNRMIARVYAEIVLACWRDQQQLLPSGQSLEEPLYVCELGGGSGRFAFHLLHHLTRLSGRVHPHPARVCYVLTDFTQSNLDFWRHHPGFAPFFASGLLDLALFDVTSSDHLTLQLSGRTIRAGNLHRPLIAIANYVFDSIPQDLYYFDEQRFHQCLVSLSFEHDPQTLGVAEWLEQAQVSYTYQPLSRAPYSEPFLQALLTDYQQKLRGGTHLLFPATGLRALQRLQALSPHGLLILSADKGDHRLSALQRKSAPDLVRHGSFSLMVNYHAFQVFCEHVGGLALFPDQYDTNITLSCLLLLSEAASYSATRAAYEQFVQEFGPDDFYLISVHARQHIKEMGVAEILAYLRLSQYDSHLLAHYLPRLLKLAATCEPEERQAVLKAVEVVLDGYFPLGEETNLLVQASALLAALGDEPYVTPG